MKKKNAFWTLLLAVFVGTGLVACSDDDDDKESIVPELIPAEDSKAFFEEGISFTYHGGEVMVVFAANTHWEVKAVQEDGEEATWCEFVGTGWGGKGQMNNFLLQVERNTGEERKAFIVVTLDGAEWVISVTQAKYNTLTVNVEQAGTLALLISEGEKNSLNELTVSGKLNGTDILFIREMAGAGVMYDDVIQDPELGLQKLDMTDAEIVEGGVFYFADATGEMYFTSKNNVSDFMFYNCVSLKEIKLPKSVFNIGFEAFYGCI